MIQILDKLCLINNKTSDMEFKPLYRKRDNGKYREHIGNELLKYLSFFELLIHNRLNMLLVHQLNASDYLLEILKLFLNK